MSKQDDVVVSFVNDDEIGIRAHGEDIYLTPRSFSGETSAVRLCRADDIPLLIYWLRQFEDTCDG